MGLSNNQNEDKNIDRVLRAGELHERGLLSDEEFEDIKNKFLNPNQIIDENNIVSNFCPSCGCEIREDYRFCVNCGQKLK